MKLSDRIADKLREHRVDSENDHALAEAERMADQYSDVRPVPYHLSSGNLFHRQAERSAP